MESLKEAMRNQNPEKLPEYVDVVLEALRMGRIAVTDSNLEKHKLCKPLVAGNIFGCPTYEQGRGTIYRLTDNGEEVAKELKSEFEVPAEVVKRIYERLEDVGLPVYDEVEGSYPKPTPDEKIIEESIEKQGGVSVDVDKDILSARFNINDFRNSVNIPHRLERAFIEIGEKSLLTLCPEKRGYFVEWNKMDGDPRLLMKVMTESGFKWMTIEQMEES
jgi:hypothetical protein